MLTIEISGKGKAELIDAWNWYENKQQGLGDRFILAFEKKLSVIIKNPTRNVCRVEGFRETLINKFPFLIIYFLHENSIIVSSVFHTSRNPKKKLK